jgi:microcystin-dependent protein
VTTGPYGSITPGDLVGLLGDPGVQNAIRAIVPTFPTVPSTSNPGDSPSAGGFGAWSQVDHVHGREGFAGPGTATTVARSDIIPIGTALAWFTASPPNGYLMCDGSAISRTTYAALFALLGTTYGAGDGATTFNLPDPRGRTFIGAGLGLGLTLRTLATNLGEEAHTLQISEMPSHNHPVPATANAGGGANFTEGAPFASTDSVNMGSTGGGGSHNNMQPSLVINWIIRAL